MTAQRTDAAERSAHVDRGPQRGEVVLPVVEVSPGVWKLRCLVQAEAEIERLRAALRDVVSMTEDCAGVPNNPDSLAQMVAARAREALAHVG